MRTKYFFLCLFGLCLIPFTAQTRRIAHKSHSGKSSTYYLLRSKKPFETNISNFGKAPQAFVRNARLDTVIALSPTLCIMITRECYISKADKQGNKKWRPGRDTIYNHSLFSKIHSLDSVKEVVGSLYYFTNPVYEMVFIGFDNQNKKKKKNP